MKKFNNIETTLVAKWFNHAIDEVVEENKNKSLTELQSLVSETVENLIKEELAVLTEGYISELIGNSFDKIDYAGLVEYYRQESGDILERKDAIWWILDNVANTSWKDAKKELIEYFEENQLTHYQGYAILTYSKDSELVGIFEKWFDHYLWGRLEEAESVYQDLLSGTFTHIDKDM